MVIAFSGIALALGDCYFLSLFFIKGLIVGPYSKDTSECVSLEGRYANCFKVGHNAYEFIIDFGQCYEDCKDRETIHSRIVTSPTYAKLLLRTLSDAVSKYEAERGVIDE